MARAIDDLPDDVASLKAMLLAERSARNRGASHNNEGANHPISVTRPKNKVQVFRSDLTGR
jgi:hypothetical protein